MTNDEAVETLNELLAQESGLTGWEMDFLESLSEWTPRPFTEKQIAVLEKIEARLLK